MVVQLGTRSSSDASWSSVKLETSDSFYHSLIHKDKDQEDSDDTPHYEGVKEQTSETTHMSWDEVSTSYLPHQPLSSLCHFGFPQTSVTINPC